MTAEAAQSILRRKARASHASVGPAAMDVPKALRLAFARAGDAVLDIPVGVREVALDAVLPEGIVSSAPDIALMLGLSDEAGATGLAIGCTQCVAAVIEAMTLGAVLPGEAEPRAPTATDAALLRDFLDRVLSTFGLLTQEMGHPPPVSGYRAGAPFEDARVAALSLADVAHKRYQITVDFGLGAKVGELSLILPAQRVATEEIVDSSAGWAGALERVVMITSAELDAHLPPVTLPLSELVALQAGDVLPLRGATLDAIRLTAPNGQRVARARLGRSGPFRAVRLMLVEADGDVCEIDALPMHPGDAAPPLSLLPAEPASMDPAPLDSAPMEIADMRTLDAVPAPAGIDDVQADIAADAQPMDLGDFAPMQVGDLGDATA